MIRQRTLVTGATGYIGARLVHKLATQHDVFCVTRSGSTAVAGTSVVADLASPFATSDWPAPIDRVIHLAQSPRYREFPDGAADMLAVNVDATARLLEYARQANCQHFVLASTGNVYEPFDRTLEETSALRPVGYYGATKVAAEALLVPYERYFPSVALRLFGPYGPLQRDRLVPNLAARMLRGEAVQLDGAEEGAILAMIYVDDVADVILAALTERWRGPINVATPEKISMRGLAEALGSHLGVGPKFDVRADRSALRLIPDLSLLASLYPLNRLRNLNSGLAAAYGPSARSS